MTKLRVLKLSTKKPRQGDVFAMLPADKVYLFGKVVHAAVTNATMPGSNPTECASRCRVIQSRNLCVPPALSCGSAHPADRDPALVARAAAPRLIGIKVCRCTFPRFISNQACMGRLFGGTHRAPGGPARRMWNRRRHRRVIRCFEHTGARASHHDHTDGGAVDGGRDLSRGKARPVPEDPLARHRRRGPGQPDLPQDDRSISNSAAVTGALGGQPSGSGILRVVTTDTATPRAASGRDGDVRDAMGGPGRRGGNHLAEFGLVPVDPRDVEPPFDVLSSIGGEPEPVRADADGTLYEITVAGGAELPRTRAGEPDPVVLETLAGAESTGHVWLPAGVGPLELHVDYTDIAAAATGAQSRTTRATDRPG